MSQTRSERLKAKREARKKAEREPDHYPLGPSSMKRIRECPGSIAIDPQDPKRKSSTWADEGTEKHAELERCLQKGVWPKDTDLQVFVGYVNGLKADYTLLAEGIEQKIRHPRIKNFGGTVDYWLLCEDRKGQLYLFVVDFKYGQFVEVDAEKNDQVMSYIKLVIDSTDTPNIPIDTLLFGTIIQPRSLVDKEPREAEFFQSDLWDLENDLEMVHKRKHEFKAGSHCQFCPAKIFTTPEGETKICPRFEEMATQTGGLPVPSNYDELLASETFMKKYYDRLRWEIQKKLRTGERVDGYGLQRSKSNRKWRDEDNARKVLLQMGVPKKVFEKQELTSPAKIEEYIKTKLGESPDLSKLTKRIPLGYNVVPENKATFHVHDVEKAYEDLK